MKVFISKYRDHWVSPYTILETVLFWKDWENISYDTPWVKKWSDILEPPCRWVKDVLDVIHPRIEYVKIDGWDVWSMDHTLGFIILPMLKKLKESKQGAPSVDDCDVPMELWSTSAPATAGPWDTDEHHFKRWDWVLDEMIWAFEQQIDDESDSQFFDHSGVDNSQPLMSQIGQTKYDVEGHRVWCQRKSNGFRLFGKYYEGLWN